MSSGASSMAWTVITPLFGAIASSFSRRLSPVVAAIASSATLVFVAAITSQVAARGPLRHAVSAWGVPLGITLRADALAVVMLSAFAVVGPLVAAYACAYFAAGRRHQFLSLWLFAWAALDALALSADVFNLYVTLELVTLASVALVILERSRAALSAGLRYLLLSLVGSLFYLIGVALLYPETATLDLELLGQRSGSAPATRAAFGFMTAGLFLKSGLFPLHAWLPPAYVSAPPPATALLSALIGKAPFIVLVRLWREVFVVVVGAGTATLAGALGAASVVWASLFALRQRRLKGVLAYSSLAHVGYLLLLFPLESARAYAGVVYVAISHAVASASMFVAAGIVERSVGRDDLEALKGVARRRPLTFFALGLAGMSLMGLPPSGGFVGKWLLARAAIERGQWWWAVLVIVGGLLAAAYFFPILRGAFLPLPRGTHLRPIPRRVELVSLTLAAVAVTMGIAPGRIVALLEAAGSP